MNRHDRRADRHRGCLAQYTAGDHPPTHAPETCDGTCRAGEVPGTVWGAVALAILLPETMLRFLVLVLAVITRAAARFQRAQDQRQKGGRSATISGAARAPSRAATRYTGPPLTSCLDHVTAAAQTGAP